MNYGLTRRRYYFWPIMLVLVSVFCWSYFQPRKQPVTVSRPVRVVHQVPAYWDYARGELLGRPVELHEQRRIIKEDKPPSIRVEIYKDGKWVEVLPAK